MKLFVGIDVSKNKLDVHINGKNTVVYNNDKGFKKIVNLLREQEKNNNEIKLVICEATGGYETKLAKYMHKEGFPMRVAHANYVRYFAKSEGLLAKTDKLDARILARYGEQKNLSANFIERSAEEEELVDLLKRREQLQEDKNREENYLEHEHCLCIKKSIKSHIKWLKVELKKLEEQIELTRKNKELQKTMELLVSIPGIGDISASYLIAFLPELGTLDHKKIVALVGLAPFNKDSGKYRGKRFIQGGRAALRRILYMNAVASVRWNKDMKVFYKRLLSRGKLKKVALIAVARKLVTTANSVMMRKTPWVEYN